VNVLHISSDYPYTSVFRELLEHLSARDFHTMYVPMPAGVQVPAVENTSSHFRVIYSSDYSRAERLLFFRKTLKVVNAIERQVKIGDVHVIHAHHLFSGGGVAHLIAKKTGIKYITAVRNTDINWFFRYAVHLRAFGARILEGASKVIFLSPAQQQTVLSKYVPSRLVESVAAKSVVIPNGVSDYWLENRYWRLAERTHAALRLLFVGQFTRNKNVSAVIRTGELLSVRGWPVEVTLLGDGPEREGLLRMAGKSNIPITIVPWTTCKSELRDRYREADVLVMPSFTETFGLVYIEAMSQGLPVVYSENQGIDGYFEPGVIGQPCDPRNVNSIADAVLAIGSEYQVISRNCTALSARFGWGGIASVYESIYSEVGQGERVDLAFGFGDE